MLKRYSGVVADFGISVHNWESSKNICKHIIAKENIRIL